MFVPELVLLWVGWVEREPRQGVPIVSCLSITSIVPQLIAGIPHEIRTWRVSRMKRTKRPEDLRVLQTICCREEIKYSLHRFSGNYSTFYPFLCLCLSHMSYVQQYSLSNPIYHSTLAYSLIQKSLGKVDPPSLWLGSIVILFSRVPGYVG
jgi:hypothetical protein